MASNKINWVSRVVAVLLLVNVGVIGWALFDELRDPVNAASRPYASHRRPVGSDTGMTVDQVDWRDEGRLEVEWSRSSRVAYFRYYPNDQRSASSIARVLLPYVPSLIKHGDAGDDVADPLQHPTFVVHGPDSMRVGHVTLPMSRRDDGTLALNADEVLVSPLVDVPRVEALKQDTLVTLEESWPLWRVVQDDIDGSYSAHETRVTLACAYETWATSPTGTASDFIVTRVEEAIDHSFPTETETENDSGRVGVVEASFAGRDGQGESKWIIASTRLLLELEPKAGAPERRSEAGSQASSGADSTRCFALEIGTTAKDSVDVEVRVRDSVTGEWAGLPAESVDVVDREAFAGSPEEVEDRWAHRVSCQIDREIDAIELSWSDTMEIKTHASGWYFSARQFGGQSEVNEGYVATVTWPEPLQPTGCWVVDSDGSVNRAEVKAQRFDRDGSQHYGLKLQVDAPILSGVLVYRHGPRRFELGDGL